MRTTIDAAGRLVIPKPVRREAHLKPGAPLEVEYRDGRVEIDPAPLPVRLVKKGPFVVAIPKARVALMTPRLVEDTRRMLRANRSR